MQTPNQTLIVPLADAHSGIRDGDLLLFRRRGLISIAGRGEHSHAAKAAWWATICFASKSVSGMAAAR